MTNLLRSFGVRGRLFLAFLGISMFAVLGAGAALLAFKEVGALFDRVTRERVPASFAALELSRQAERITAATPLLLTATSVEQRMRSDRKIRKDLVELDQLFAEVKSGRPDRALLSDIENSVAEIRRNIGQLQEISNPYAASFGDKLAESEKLLQNNSEASARLTAAVDRFVNDERVEIMRAGADVATTQRNSTAVLLGVVALSLITSALIVWLYVGRNIIKRLTPLSTSMLAIAGGNLKTPLPVGSNNDEIGRMADALRIFRDTADEVERVRRLKRFLAPQVAELIVSSGDECVLNSHRREVAVLFCDLRGFTAFAEAAEPEEVMDLLRDYHSTLGQLVHTFAGTLERYTGDGLMVIFNDPLPCPDPCLTAVRLAVEMRAQVKEITRRHQLDSRLGFGIGIAYGYATLGRVGFEGRFDYTAIGSVVNLAARLCEQALADQILVDSKMHGAVKGQMEIDGLGEFLPKGFTRPIEVFNISGQRAGGAG